jgi:hypothetical protein
VCRDFAVDDVGGLVRDLAERSIPGAGFQEMQPAPQHVGNGTCVKWHEGHACSPVRKAYPKRRDLIRTEIVLRNRTAVRTLLHRAGGGGSVRADLSGAGVAILLEHIAVAAAPLLDAVRVLVHETAQAEPRSGVDLIMGLSPLQRLARPAPRPAGTVGRLPADDLTRRAEDVMRRLILDGRYHAKSGPGMSSSGSIVVALREMTGNDGILVAAPNHPRLFVVRPDR